ncbi:MAG: MerR family transcriptional regulator [Endomicrobium sp.]|jgi:DNA-binding transcriptional MerR regulator|nr:MerR family transcriptional regulator [Endomicrobium sp.]
MFQVPTIPDKEYFGIGEVSQITLIPKYTLRYWECEFKLLRPARSNSGQRKYRREEIEIIFHIKELLYDKRFTIEGVKKYLFLNKRRNINVQSGSNFQYTLGVEFLNDIKSELRHIIKLLKK